MKTVLCFILIFASVTVAFSQNIDSFTTSNQNPLVCDTVALINLSTNFTSLIWEITGGTYQPVLPWGNNPKIIIKDTGCFDITLIIKRGQVIDSLVKKCYLKVLRLPRLIQLLGKEIDSIEVLKHPYVDPGFTGLLSCIDAKSTKSEGHVNTNKVGKYILKYSLEMFNGWKDSTERIVYVVDRIAPKIQLLNKIDSVDVDSSYYPKLIITDDYCCTPDMKIHHTNTVDTSKLGLYSCKIWVVDCNGNYSDTLEQQVYVADRTKPVIKWLGHEIYQLERWDTLAIYFLDYIKITDNYDRNLKPEITGTYFSSYLKNFYEGKYFGGLYFVQIDANDFSGNKALSVFFYVFCEGVAIKETQFANRIDLYPNPNNGQFVISVDEPQKVSSVQIFDLFGKRILEYSDIQKTNEIMLPASCKGMYLIQINTDAGRIFKKINVFPNLTF
jgi:hypothetical protein